VTIDDGSIEKQTPVAQTGDAKPLSRHRWHEVFGSSAWILINFIVFIAILQHRVKVYEYGHAQVGTNMADLSRPVIGWVWIQVLANGILLCVPRRTRAVGAGIVLASATLAISVLLWATYLIATW